MSDVLSQRVTSSAHDLPLHARPIAPKVGSQGASEDDEGVETATGPLYVAAAEIDHASGTVQSPGVNWVPAGVFHAAASDAERTLCGHLLRRLYPFRGLDFRHRPDAKLCRRCAERAGLGSTDPA